MFNSDFYPITQSIFDDITDGLNLFGKKVFEPHAGKGDMIRMLQDRGADVICCENDPTLKIIAAYKAHMIAEDFFTVTAAMIANIDYIIMNPPFINAAQHIAHAYMIAPPGCKIYSLCNYATIADPYSRPRKDLLTLITEHGNTRKLGQCFRNAERKTDVEVALVVLQKPNGSYETEFDGFFMDEDPKQDQIEGIIQYNAIEGMVNRYVAAMKLYDEQLKLGEKMGSLLRGVYDQSITFVCTSMEYARKRNEFKKSLQKSGWDYIFKKLRLEKYATSGLKNDINKFVERQQELPFTMKNIYRMLEIIAGTTTQRIDKALEEVFDKITSLCENNKYYWKPGWKTNSHFLVGQKFILNGLCYQDRRFYSGSKIEFNRSSSNNEILRDFLKALCYITGDDYYNIPDLDDQIRYKLRLVNPSTGEYFKSEANFKPQEWHQYDLPSVQSVQKQQHKEGKYYDIEERPECAYGSWFDWGYFRVKAFKVGTMHFEFKDKDIWARFNQRIAKIKGYPLFEPKKQTAYQKRKSGRNNVTEREKEENKKAA